MTIFGLFHRYTAAILTVVCLCMSVLSSCQSFKTPEIREPYMITVQVLRWTNNEPIIRIESHCYNPNAVGFDFKGGKLDLHLDTFFLGQAVVDTAFHVKPHSNFMVPVVMQIPFVPLLNKGLNLEKELAVKVEGKMTGKAVGITKTLPIRYLGKHKLELVMEPF